MSQLQPHHAFPSTYGHNVSALDLKPLSLPPLINRMSQFNALNVPNSLVTSHHHLSQLTNLSALNSPPLPGSSASSSTSGMLSNSSTLSTSLSSAAAAAAASTLSTLSSLAAASSTSSSSSASCSSSSPSGVSAASPNCTLNAFTNNIQNIQNIQQLAQLKSIQSIHTPSPPPPTPTQLNGVSIFNNYPIQSMSPSSTISQNLNCINSSINASTNSQNSLNSNCSASLSRSASPFNLYSMAYSYALNRRKCDLENLHQRIIQIQSSLPPPPLIATPPSSVSSYMHEDEECAVLDLSKNKSASKLQQQQQDNQQPQQQPQQPQQPQQSQAQQPSKQQQQSINNQLFIQQQLLLQQQQQQQQTTSLPPPPLKEKRSNNQSIQSNRIGNTMMSTEASKINKKASKYSNIQHTFTNVNASKISKLSNGNKKLNNGHKRPTRRLPFDEHKSSPVSGTIILAEPEDKLARDNAENAAKYCYVDIDPSLNLVEVTPEARMELEKIPNLIGDYICCLCQNKFNDAFELAQHRCSCFIVIAYPCPECDKTFHSPANLASHRRWHRPNAQSNSSSVSSTTNCGSTKTNHQVSSKLLANRRSNKSHSHTNVSMGGSVASSAACTATSTNTNTTTTTTASGSNLVPISACSTGQMHLKSNDDQTNTSSTQSIDLSLNKSANVLSSSLSTTMVVKRRTSTNLPIRPASTGSIMMNSNKLFAPISPRPVSTTPTFSITSDTLTKSLSTQLTPINVSLVNNLVNDNSMNETSVSAATPPPAMPAELSTLTKVTVAGQPIELSVSGSSLTSDLYHLNINHMSKQHMNEQNQSAINRRLPHKIKVNGTAFIPEQMVIAPITSSIPKHSSNEMMAIGGEVPNTQAANPSGSAIIPALPTSPFNLVPKAQSPSLPSSSSSSPSSPLPLPPRSPTSSSSSLASSSSATASSSAIASASASASSSTTTSTITSSASSIVSTQNDSKISEQSGTSAFIDNVQTSSSQSQLDLNDLQEYCPKKFRRLAYFKKNEKINQQPQDAQQQQQQQQSSNHGVADNVSITDHSNQSSISNDGHMECKHALSASDQMLNQTSEQLIQHVANTIKSSDADTTMMLTQKSIATACELALEAMAADVYSGALVQRKKRALSVTAEEEFKVKRDASHHHNYQQQSDLVFDQLDQIDQIDQSFNDDSNAFDQITNFKSINKNQAYAKQNESDHENVETN